MWCPGYLQDSDCRFDLKLNLNASQKRGFGYMPYNTNLYMCYQKMYLVRYAYKFNYKSNVLIAYIIWGPPVLRI